MVAKTYVNKIVRKVKCSRQKRNEIRKQLLSDVTMATAQGEPLDKVMLRMGEPIAVADEFNQNLSEKERKRYRQGIAVKAIAVIAAVFAVLALAAAWFLPRTVPFGGSGIFVEEEVEERCKEVVRLLDAEDYGAVRDCSDATLKEVLTEEVIRQAKEQAGANWGGFREFGKCYMNEYKWKGKDWVAVQINAAYENIGITYTLQFNEDMELSGLFIK